MYLEAARRKLARIDYRLDFGNAHLHLHFGNAHFGNAHFGNARILETRILEMRICICILEMRILETRILETRAFWKCVLQGAAWSSPMKSAVGIFSQCILRTRISRRRIPRRSLPGILRCAATYTTIGLGHFWSG
jgi:hypothetical protein